MQWCDQEESKGKESFKRFFVLFACFLCGTGVVAVGGETEVRIVQGLSECEKVVGVRI